MESRSFVAAAERLGLTPPAVSMQLGKLAEILGAPLFERDGRSVRPTDMATTLVPYAERVLTTLREGIGLIGAEQAAQGRVLRISMVTTSRNFGPQLLRAFSVHHPDILVDLTIANRQDVIAKLESGRCDIALMGRMPSRFAVEAHRFAPHPYAILAHPDHPLAAVAHVSRVALARHRFILREPGSGTRMVHDSYFRDAGVTPAQVVEMDSNANIKQAVMADMGLAFLSLHTVDLERKAGRLVVLRAEETPQVRDWFVLHLADHRLNAAARTFRDYVIAEGPAFMQEFFAD